jgi:hypothetical protein
MVWNALKSRSPSNSLTGLPFVELVQHSLRLFADMLPLPSHGQRILVMTLQQIVSRWEV